MYVYIYQKLDICYSTSHISVSSKPLKTQWKNEKCKKYKSGNWLKWKKSNERINKTSIKSDVKIFPITW